MIGYEREIADSMERRSIIGLLGCVALFFGVFAPILKAPIIGSVNYFNNGKGDGVIIMFLAGISLILIFARIFKGLWITGLAAMAFMVGAFIKFQRRLGEMKSSLNAELGDNPFKGIADLAANSVQMQWGWALLIVGAALLIAAAASKDQSRNTTS
jgi:hypothetical protein